MTSDENALAWPDHKPTALLVLADGTVLEGFGLGAKGQAVGARSMRRKERIVAAGVVLLLLGGMAWATVIIPRVMVCAPRSHRF